MVQTETNQGLWIPEDDMIPSSETPSRGHPVIVVPPVLRSDKNMVNMRDWINNHEFRAFESGIEDSRTRDPKNDVLKIISKIDEVFEETRQKITLVGFSLGGIYAFVAAMYRPEKIQRVVLVGTPIRRHVADAAKGRYKEIAKAIINGNPSYNSFLSAISTTSMPFDYDLACIYTRDDEAFHWEDCLDERADIAVEVRGQHRKLYNNPKVFTAVTDILQAPIDRPL